MKKEKGITLIALIITIIVMLILVGVTINIAISGGLFETAQNAKQNTLRESEKEELFSLAIGTVSSTGNLQITTRNLTKDGWTAEQSENASFLKCTSPKNEVFYINTATGEILDELPSGSEDTYYNISFKDLSEINLLNVFPEEEIYAIVFTSKEGINSVIQVVPDSGQLRGLMFSPDMNSEPYYEIRYYGSTQEITSWKYYSSYSVEVGEEKAPEALENVKINYTAGSSVGISDFTENMLKSICNVTEVNE